MRSSGLAFSCFTRPGSVLTFSKLSWRLTPVYFSESPVFFSESPVASWVFSQHCSWIIHNFSSTEECFLSSTRYIVSPEMRLSGHPLPSQSSAHCSQLDRTLDYRSIVFASELVDDHSQRHASATFLVDFAPGHFELLVW